MPEVLGHVDDGWGKVADAFRSNLEDHDLGAAFCAEVGGRRVVDVWGGVADARTGRPWQEDTIAVVFSVTKGAVAICANRLVERGELDLDEPVATYWPEFAAHGKGAIPVRWLLTHQAGLPVVDVPLTVQDVCAWYPVIRALEAQRPLWEPGSRHAYHAHTFGFLVGEVVRRAHGRTVGAMFAGDVARPLGLSAWIGLPEGEEDRVAHLRAAPPAPPEMAAMVEQFAGPDTILGRALSLGGAFPELVTETGGFNARMVRAAEMPGANMVSDARSLARLYSATIAEVDGARLLEPATLAAATAQQTTDSDMLGMPAGFEALAMRFATGFMVPGPMFAGFGPRTFGHPGASGSTALADPDTGLAVGYVVNQMGGTGGDPRTGNLFSAVEACMG